MKSGVYTSLRRLFAGISVNECNGDLSTATWIDVRSSPNIGVYNSSMNLSLRLATTLSPVLVWGVLYLASRLGGISPTRFTPWLRAGFFVLMVLSITFIVFDRTRLGNFVSLHGWGLYSAELWIKHHYKHEREEELVTSLKL